MFKILRAAMLTSIVGVGTASTASAGVIFQDGFESGTKSLITNLMRWLTGTDTTTVSTTKPLNGNYSLQFLFKGGPAGQDAWAEQRIALGKQYTEVWIKYNLFIPSNYYHRQDGASNNKFFAIYSAPYTSPGFQVNFSTQPASGGGSEVGIHFYKSGVEQSAGGYPSGALITASDLGKWQEIIMHFKVPSSSTSADGVMELWKNGGKLIGITNLPSNGTSGKNYMDEAYLLGWANSGFSTNTYLYIDDVVISDTPLASGGSSTPTTSAPPSAPRLSVQPAQ